MSGYFGNSMYNQNGNIQPMNMQFYNPMQPQMDRLQQIQQQQQNQQQFNSQQYSQPQQPQSNVNWVQVTNMQNAKEQIVQPNNTMWMMDASKPQIYVKSVSNVGTIEFKAYKLVDIEEENNLSSNNIQQIDGQNYVHIDEFNKLAQVVQELTAKIAMYEALFQGQQTVKEEPKTTGRRGGANNESSK